MLKHAIVVFIALQIHFVAADKFDDARNQLDDLQALLKGTILSAENDLNELILSFQDYTSDIVIEGTILIQTQQVKVNTLVAQLKALAEWAAADITSCLEEYEDPLNALPDELISALESCASDKVVNDATLIVADTIYLVDVLYNRVNEIEFQLALCDTEACVEPILDLIALESVQLPEKVDIEVIRAQDLFDILKLSVQDCQDAGVGDYVGSSNVILQDLADCINEIID